MKYFDVSNRESDVGKSRDVGGPAANVACLT